MFRSLVDDFSAAWRSLVRSPGFLLTASSVLGLGLGATFFMFAVMNTLYLKPPPFAHGDRLYRVFARTTLTGETHDEVQFPDYLELRSRQRSSDDLAALSWNTATVTGEGIPERFDAVDVTPNLFALLGVEPKIGRSFSPADASPGAAPVAIISHAVWHDRYGSRLDVVGRQAVIDGVPTTVVGVLPEGFGIIGGEGVWRPIRHDAATLTRGADAGFGVWVFGRARAGVDAAQVGADLSSVMAELQRENPRSNSGVSASVLPLATGIIGPDSVKSLRRQFGVACLTLLVACLTVATLLFVRATYRQFETAMRMALGAAPTRVLQAVLCETLIVAALGLLIGFAVASAGLRHYADLVAAISVFGGVPAWWTFSIDWRVIAFAVVAAVVSATLAGIVPALRVSRRSVADTLRESTRTSTSRRLNQFMGLMVSVELALAVALLCGAGLLAHGAYRFVARDFGVAAEGMLAGSIALSSDRYPGPAYDRFVTRLLDRLRDQPGVQGAVAATALPGLGAPAGSVVFSGWEGRPFAELPTVDAVAVSKGYLAGSGAQVIYGREFDSRDRSDSPPVAVVNAAFVEMYFQGHAPLGERVALRFGADAPLEWRTIIGVAANINHGVTWGRNGSWRPTVYSPLGQRTPPWITIGLRGGGAPVEQSRILRETVRTLDPDLPVYHVRPLSQAQSEVRAGYQLGSVTLLGFSVIGFVLAIAGLYAVLAFTVGQRTREIGIRRALGARDAQIAVSVIKGTATQLLVGLGLGAVLTPFAVDQSVALMEGLPVSSPFTYALAFGLVILVAFVFS